MCVNSNIMLYPLVNLFTIAFWFHDMSIINSVQKNIASYLHFSILRHLQPAYLDFVWNAAFCCGNVDVAHGTTGVFIWVHSEIGISKAWVRKNRQQGNRQSIIINRKVKNRIRRMKRWKNKKSKCNWTLQRFKVMTWYCFLYTTQYLKYATMINTLRQFR